MEQLPENPINKFRDPRPAPEHSAQRDALVGIGLHGLHRPVGMSTLTGDEAMSELDRDIKAFEAGATGKGKSAFLETTAAYRRALGALLVLDRNAVLSNKSDGAYEPSFRTDSTVDRTNLVISHTVFLPFQPGGFLKFRLDLRGPADDLDLGFNTWQEYFEGDIAGREADRPYNDERNEKCLAALKTYVVESVNRDLDGA